MRNFFLSMAIVVAGAAHADVFLGEVKTAKCSRLKNKDFMTYIKAALGDNKLDVTYDEHGSCGKSAYIMKKSSRRRWAAFPDEKGCKCYLDTLKVIDKSK